MAAPAPAGLISGHRLAVREAAVERLAGLFGAAGHERVEPRHLLDADVLLDLYGEDIRTRAFLFPEPVTAGELCLRPDFTVPVAIAHGSGGWQRRAAYAYAGPVFRIQERTARPIEYLQAGIERYGDADRGSADAEVLALVLEGLDALGAAERRISTGDPGLFFALIDALPISGPRKAGLRRHFWRPQRFKDLLESYIRRGVGPSPARARLLAAAAEGAEAVEAMAAGQGEVLGLRGLDEIAARATTLAEAVAEPPMPADLAVLIEAVLSVRGASGASLGQIRALTADAGVDIGAALERFERRLEALNAVGIDAEELPFDARFGRMMEYYDGFVFEIEAVKPGLPPLAGGGRYDRMTERLGAARPVPAVGAMIRPEAALAAARGEGS